MKAYYYEREEKNRTINCGKLNFATTNPKTTKYL